MRTLTCYPKEVELPEQVDEAIGEVSIRKMTLEGQKPILTGFGKKSQEETYSSPVVGLRVRAFEKCLKIREKTPRKYGIC
jgi:hypothetical protein